MRDGDERRTPVGPQVMALEAIAEFAHDAAALVPPNLARQLMEKCNDRRACIERRVKWNRIDLVHYDVELRRPPSIFGQGAYVHRRLRAASAKNDAVTFLARFAAR